MRSFLPAIALMTVLAAQFLCCGTTPPAPPTEAPAYQPPEPVVVTEPPVQASIGYIEVRSTRLQSGPENNLTDAENGRPLVDNDHVFAYDGGNGRLHFDDGTTLTLYNQTKLDGVTAQVSPPEVDLLLQNQGFEGEVPPGHKASIHLPNGGGITIHGTTFFVIYNASLGIATAGNFSGSVSYTPPGGSETILPDGRMVDIFADGTVSPELLIGFSPRDFDDAAISSSTPLDAMNALREKSSVPVQGGPYTVVAFPVVPQPNENFIPVAYRGLVSWDGKSYLPDLARSWEVDPDGVIYVFYLQPGLLLGDGQPFTSGTVKDMLYKSWSPAIDGAVAVEIVDDYTVRFYNYKGIDLIGEMSKILYDIQIH